MKLTELKKIIKEQIKNQLSIPANIRKKMNDYLYKVCLKK